MSNAAIRFRTDGTINPIGGSYNKVFDAHRNQQSIILKIIPSTIFNLNTILSELEWVRFLSDTGLKVCLPLLSANGQYVEVLHDSSDTYYALGFEKSHGSIVDHDGSYWNHKLFRKWGATMGMMHAAAVRYHPENPQLKRPEWHQHPLFDLASFPRVGGDIVRQKWLDAREWLDSLDTPISAYGLIHNDMHHYNFHLDNGDLVLFDFGDCEYGWFAYDIAISVYHAAQTASDENRNGFARKFLDDFLEGYRLHYDLESTWIHRIPKFTEYRRLYSLVFFLNHAETFTLRDDAMQAINKMKMSVEQNEPYIAW